MAQVVQCPSCQKSYAYKPELAGKRVKCKCGGRIEFPLTPPLDELEMAAQAMAAEEKASAAPPSPRPVSPSLLAPRPAPPTAAATTPPPADAVVASGEAKAKCPHCQAALAEGAVICTGCGFNLKTGAMVAAPATPSDAAPDAAEPGAKKRKLLSRKVLAVAGIALIAFLGLGAGAIWLWGSHIPGIRKVPVIGWLASTRFDACRKFIPDDALNITFFDVKSIRKSQPYHDDKASLEGMMNGALQADKSIDAVDAMLKVTGRNGSSITYIKFNADQPKERVFPPGKPPQQGKIDAYTSYVISPFGQEAVWLDARQVLLGTHAALLSSIAHYDGGTEAALTPEMLDAMDWAGSADLINISAGLPTGNVPRVMVATVEVGNTMTIHGRLVYGDSQMAAQAAAEAQKAQAGPNPNYSTIPKGATITQNGNAVEIRATQSYSESKKLAGFGY